MSFDAGTLEARLDVDRDPFQVGLDQAKADAEEFASKTYSVTLDVNDNGIAKLDEFMARLNAFDFQRPTAVLDVNFADDAIAKMDTAEAMLAGFGHEHVTATADVNVNDASAGLRGLEQDVTNTERTLGRLGDTSTSVGTKMRQTKNDTDILKGGLVDVTDGTKHFISGMSAVDDANRALSQGMKDANQGLLQVGIGLRAAEGDGVAMSQIIGNVGTSASSSSGGTNQLGASLGSLGSSSPYATAGLAVLATALIPIAGVATGAGIALVGMATAGLAGIGGFALAAAGSLGGFTSTLKSEVANWQASFHGLVQPVVNDITGLIAPALNSLSPIVASATAAISSAVSSIGSGLHSSGFADFIGFLAGQAPNAIATFTVALENMGRGFASILEAFSPFISSIELGIVSLSGKFADLGNSSGLQSFVGYVQKEAPVVGSFFEAIVPTVGKLLAALAPMGDAVLRLITPFIVDLGHIAPIIELVAGAADLLARGFEVLLVPLEHVSAFIGHLAGDFGGFLGTIGNWIGLNNQAADSTKSLTDALTKAGLSTKDAQRDIELFGTTTITNMGVANFAAEQLGNKVGLTAQQFVTLEKQTNTSGQATVTALQKAASSANITTSAMGELELATGKAGTAITSSLNQAASATQSSFNSATSGIAAFSGQVGVSAQSVATFYGTAQIGAQQFQDNIQSIIAAKYPAALVQQVQEAGPKAGGFLQALVDAEGTGYQSQITQAFNALNAIGQEAVQEARLTQQAILSGTSQMADNLSTAMSIQQQRSAQGAAASVGTIANTLQLGIPQVAAIAGIYGLALPGAMTASQGQTFLTAQAQGKSVTDALIAAVGPTQAQAEITAGVLPGALNQNIPPTAGAANTQASQVYLAHIAALGATETAAYNTAVALPNAVNLQALVTAANAYNMAVGVGTGINQAAPGAGAAASGLAGFVTNNMGLPSFFGTGADAGNSLAGGLNSSAGAVAAAAANLRALASLGLQAVPGVTAPGHATGTGMGTFQGMTWVGEQGPELVNFLQPVQIMNTQQSKEMASSAGSQPLSGSSSSGVGSSLVVAPQIQVSVVVQGNLDNVTLPQVRQEVTGALNDFTSEFLQEYAAR